MQVPNGAQGIEFRLDQQIQQENVGARALHQGKDLTTLARFGDQANVGRFVQQRAQGNGHVRMVVHNSNSDHPHSLQLKLSNAINGCFPRPAWSESGFHETPGERIP